MTSWQKMVALAIGWDIVKSMDGCFSIVTSPAMNLDSVVIVHFDSCVLEIGKL